MLTAVERHVNWETVKCLVIAGPGFVKDDFKKHMDAEAVRRDLRYHTSHLFASMLSVGARKVCKAPCPNSCEWVRINLPAKRSANLRDFKDLRILRTWSCDCNAEYLRQKLTVCRPLMTNKSKVILAPASSAYQHSIKEVLANPGLAAQIKVGPFSSDKHSFNNSH